jgi:hypothetical protein
MITAEGYSKEPIENATGIAVTFGKDMMQLHGGILSFLNYFQLCMSEESGLWYHKCKNRPTFEVSDVYIICLNRLYGRVNLVGYSNDKQIMYRANSDDVEICDWKRIELTGPFERCPFKRTLRGFQGFRYATKLF